MRGIPARGDAIRRLRKAQGLSQEAFAHACDCTPRTVRNAERGERVDAATLARFAQQLDAPLATLSALGEPHDAAAQQHVATVKAWLDAFMAADVDRLMPLHHPEVMMELPGTEGLPQEAGAGSYQGLDGVREHFLGVFSFFEPLEASDHAFDAADNLVFHRSTMSCKNRQTGYVITARYFNEFEFQQGLIIRRMSISDLTEHRRSFETPNAPPEDPDARH